jgi:hypothetical protein
MADSPSPEQFARGERVVKWVLAIGFWLAIAPTLFMVGSYVATVPLVIALSAFGIADPSHPSVSLVRALGVAAGVGLVWLVWRQARSYYAQRAA